MQGYDRAPSDGYKVVDANGESLVYTIYGRDNRGEADAGKGLTLDEARRIALNVAKLPELLKSADRQFTSRTSQNSA